MKRQLKRLLGNTAPYRVIAGWQRRGKEQQEVEAWERRGRPVPPPHRIKQETLRQIADEYGLQILVETGTYLGDMVESLKGRFKKIYSIELSRELYNQATKRFAKDGNVELIHGDSGVVLAALLSRIDQPALFWLDGHYSAGVTARGKKDTPIFEELGHILSSMCPGHVIIVDDARCFGEDPGYPTIAELSAFVHSKCDHRDIRVVTDMIRITPKRT